ncbi:prepilin-type N-terminal cleavage/methylation domain-containing protein [Rossellomorea aquimaris]|uniref:competence type IV pilus minor pilin ComGD n=1 Tax=Rossellomorea aquimaris TaxID=189382 RepID=UPI001CD701FC|nr:competence type IV pilus minor pilin ComGD [Rossellomorea aquimaris]MCA1058140.1 prepilin-type N-terminal cleavage/methylation domain-containing protein [Rossellomorea aquimaris]
MNVYRTEEAGYTLIEMLIVLFIFTILLSWVGFSVLPLKSHIEKDLFISQLESDLYQIQSYSIHHQTPIFLTFYPFTNKYVAKTGERQTIVSRDLPVGIQMISNNSLEEITFYPNGNTSRFGRVNFQMGDITMHLIFQIGQGRFYVQEY